MWKCHKRLQCINRTYSHVKARQTLVRNIRVTPCWPSRCRSAWYKLETDVLLRPGFRWRPQLSRRHNKVYSPPGGGGGAQQGKGQGGFLIILALHYNILIWIQRGDSPSRVAKLQPHEYFVAYVRECLTWCADLTGPRVCYAAYGDDSVFWNFYATCYFEPR